MSFIRKIWDVTTTIIAVIALGLFIAIAVIPLLFGGSYRIVATGSMEPSISPGDIVVMKAPSLEEIEVGKVVTFLPYSNNETTITHRVIETNEEEGTYITRGDANGADDKPIKYEQIRGVVMYTVPYVGLLVSPLRNLLIGNTGTGIIAIIGTVLVLYGLTIILKSLFTKKDKQKDTEKCSKEN